MAAKSKKIAKKVIAKKSSPAKKVTKKAVAKRAGPKKEVKKASNKTTTPAKKVAQKVAVKKAVTKKAAPQKSSPVKRVNKPVARKGKAKVKAVSAASTPAMAELSEELVEKAANTADNKPIPEQMQTAQEPEQDPIQAFDKHAYNKATTKGDPHSRLHLSSKPKNAIKPSGKKPLWR